MGEQETAVVPAGCSGKGAHPLAALTRLISASTGTNKVTVLAKGFTVCNARATSTAILLLSFYPLRLVALPPMRELLLACLPREELGGG